MRKGAGARGKNIERKELPMYEYYCPSCHFIWYRDLPEEYYCPNCGNNLVIHKFKIMAPTKRADKLWEKLKCEEWTQEEAEEVLRYEQIRERGQ